jgi:uncharacterized protein YjbI with pentapeptide repeats
MEALYTPLPEITDPKDWDRFDNRVEPPVWLRGAVMRGARFRWAHLDGQDFRDALLFGATFRKASLRGADFTNANARSAKFCLADLRGAQFRFADLSKADFTGAQIETDVEFWVGARVRGAKGLPDELVMALADIQQELLAECPDFWD